MASADTNVGETAVDSRKGAVLKRSKRASIKSLRAEDVEYVRINGFDKPNGQQIGAWVLIVSVAAAYFAIVENLTSRWRPAAYIVVGIAVAVVVGLMLICTLIDPADPAVRRQRREGVPRRRGREDLHQTTRSRVIEDDVCFLCETTVGYKTKHCGTCNKCIVGFDHHCVWLNNCVGSRTYHLFISLLLTGAFTSTAVSTVCVAILVHHFSHTGGLEEGYTAYGQPISAAGLVTVAILILIFMALTIYFVGDLLILHARLVHRGWTTYDYIVHLREQTRRRESGEPLERPLGCPCSQPAGARRPWRRPRKVAPGSPPPPTSVPGPAAPVSVPAGLTPGGGGGGTTTPTPGNNEPHTATFSVVTHPLVSGGGGGGVDSTTLAAQPSDTADDGAAATLPSTATTIVRNSGLGIDTVVVGQRHGDTDEIPGGDHLDTGVPMSVLPPPARSSGARALPPLAPLGGTASTAPLPGQSSSSMASGRLPPLSTRPSVDASQEGETRVTMAETAI
eukprot:m.94418 g.94418  ORF g.94418 m.94418 type:complete len:507 (+) comp10047_c0_seq4:207-1727(+)